MTISEQLDSYMKKVVPAEACKTQKDETQKAFWAGALAFSTAMRVALHSPKPMTAYKNLEEELMAYIATIGATDVQTH